MSSAAAIPAFGVPKCNIVVCGSGNGGEQITRVQDPCEMTTHDAWCTTLRLSLPTVAWEHPTLHRRQSRPSTSSETWPTDLVWCASRLLPDHSHQHCCCCCYCRNHLAAQTAAAVLGSQGHTVWLYYSPRYQQRAAEMRAALAVNGGAITLTAHALPTAEALDGTTTYKVRTLLYLYRGRQVKSRCIVHCCSASSLADTAGTHHLPAAAHSCLDTNYYH